VPARVQPYRSQHPRASKQPHTWLLRRPRLTSGISEQPIPHGSHDTRYRSLLENPFRRRTANDGQLSHRPPQQAGRITSEQPIYMALAIRATSSYSDQRSAPATSSYSSSDSATSPQQSALRTRYQSLQSLAIGAPFGYQPQRSMFPIGDGSPTMATVSVF
jgi:hypothetical protein